ncbi:helix-turn-helix domain-containing protein [Bacillus sp. AK128]
MNYLFLTTLYGLDKINGERTIYSIFHLYKGKRSSQTIQDAKLFNLEPLFGVIPDLTRTTLDQVINTLENKEYISSVGDGAYILTHSGRNELNSFDLPEALNGWAYSSIAPVLWERLSLTIQCLSYLIHHNNRFIPINRDPSTLQWVKSFLRKQPATRELTAKKLHEEMFSILSLLGDQHSTILVYKLTSVERVGYTNTQIAELLNLDPLKVSILFQSTLHFILRKTEENIENFPVLRQLSMIANKPSTLTHSTFKTLELIQKGKSIEEVAAIRSLKKNTIEDHVVEIVLTNPSFDVTPFITKAHFEEISECVQRTKTNQLKVIKQILTIEASYFEIRLVMAKMGGAHEITNSAK